MIEASATASPQGEVVMVSSTSFLCNRRRDEGGGEGRDEQ